MTTFDDRERAFETRFARDQEMQFGSPRAATGCSASGRRGKMGLTGPRPRPTPSDVVHADFEEAGDEDVIRKLLGDLTSAGVESTKPRIREALEHKTVEARRQLMERRADADAGRRDRSVIRAGFPMPRSRSPTWPATATIMPRGWSPRASGGCRASSSTSASTRRWADGWAASSTRSSSPPPYPIEEE